MAKRFVSKVGNIFCVEFSETEKAYFQYITSDMSNLNSSVIRVFKRRYPIDAQPTMNEIVDDEIDFYAHTVLKYGYLYNVWYKVGTHKNIGDTENIMFRILTDTPWVNIVKSHNWYVWKINCESEYVGELSEEQRKYDMGFVYSWPQIVNRIKTGQWLSKYPL